MLRRSHTAALVIGAAMIAAGCAATSMNVSSHVRRGAEFRQYGTYAWGPSDELPAGDPQLDRNPYIQDYLQGAVEKHLAARGFKLSTDTPDLLLHYHASIDTRVDVSRSEHEYERCQSTDCASWVVDYEAGTLVLDVVDARTNQFDLAGLGAGQRGGVGGSRGDGEENH
jgi:hypothetical protein